MNALLIAVSMGSAAAAGITGYVVYRMRNKNKNARQKRAQIQRRLDGMERKRKLAVAELNKLLGAKLSDLAYSNGGTGALHAAQQIAEEVFYDWLNHNFGLFYCAMADSHIRITGVRNGFFQYELPDQLKQYKG
uniref:Uncharacterized protein n=1 Tax=Burkholderia phage vB_BgluM-SURPRISE13 TaxID=3159457 RepID=A0AAU7PFG2_9VIRU